MKIFRHFHVKDTIKLYSLNTDLGKEIILVSDNINTTLEVLIEEMEIELNRLGPCPDDHTGGFFLKLVQKKGRR